MCKYTIITSSPGCGEPHLQVALEVARVHVPDAHEEPGSHAAGGAGWYVETNGLKGLYFQGVETQAGSTRGVELMCSTCTSSLTMNFHSVRKLNPSSSMLQGRALADI